jgi:hypothetical protein
MSVAILTAVSRRDSFALLLLALHLLVSFQFTSAANPVVPDVGMADPHIHFWGATGTAYMYSTHDFSPNNTGFLMKNWWIWASTDLVHWALQDELEPQDTPASPSAYDECWATDAAVSVTSNTGPGYFFYLSIGPEEVAVVNSSGPTGPWTNALRRPLLTVAMGQSLNPPTQLRDPCVFEDDDGAHYIISGVFNYYIARLGADLMSLSEPLRLIHVINPIGPYGNSTDDKPFIHKHRSRYYLSWGCFYGVSNTSVYGPYLYVGTAITTESLDPAFRMNSSAAGPWYSHEDYADRHGSFFTMHGQWYYACNDRSHSSARIGDRSYFRDTVLGIVHYFDNGTIQPVRIQAGGVHNHAAVARGEPLIVEAEDFFALVTADGVDGRHGPRFTRKRYVEAHNGFVIAHVNCGASVTFAGVELPPAAGGALGLTVHVLLLHGSFDLHRRIGHSPGAVATAFSVHLDGVLVSRGQILHEEVSGLQEVTYRTHRMVLPEWSELSTNHEFVRHSSSRVQNLTFSFAATLDCKSQDPNDGEVSVAFDSFVISRNA